MEILSVKNLSFKYDANDTYAFRNASFSVSSGDFALLCGLSGCGKTTLLRLIKATLRPSGICDGSISCSLPDEQIGFVFQSPDSQLVMDTVMDELIFGCENIGMSSPDIRLRLSELSAFFGIESLLDRKCHTLSGGQKQLVNLASVMMMKPELLLLDEPLSQLDPVAASDFLHLLDRIHRELGTAVIICEHNIENLLDRADYIIYMERCNDSYSPLLFSSGTAFVSHILDEQTDSEFDSFYENLPDTVKYDHPLRHKDFSSSQPHGGAYSHLHENLPPAVYAKNIYFRYEKQLPDVIAGLNVTIPKGCIAAVIGGNGAGKSTLLSVLTGFKKPYRGRLSINGSAAYLPQNPAYAFIEDELLSDLQLLCRTNGIDENRIYELSREYAGFSAIPGLFGKNPLDLSGGQRQLAALYKLLLLQPDILLLDEPTKGLDGAHKAFISDMFKQLAADGITIIMVSHDLSFVSRTASHCGMMFRGDFCVFDTTDSVLSSNHFYTAPLYRLKRLRNND